MYRHARIVTSLAGTVLAPHAEALARAAQAATRPSRHGDLPRWEAALALLPEIEPGSVDLSHGVRIGDREDADAAQRRCLREALMALRPWRKGPVELFGVKVDAEWRSDWKWARVLAHLEPLAGRRILDVGCGNGYYALRMLGQGAAEVIGLDPSLLFNAQFLALRRYLRGAPVQLLPLGVEALPPDTAAFDTVFSMGVLYHRREPLEHLRTLLGALRPGGQLVLETLVIEGEAGEVLVPSGRYARMRNVWALPSVPTLLRWLGECGVEGGRVVDLCATTVEEQRATEWMPFHSLRDFLDPDAPHLTVEGHPAPLRAVLVGRAPGA